MGKQSESKKVKSKKPTNKTKRKRSSIAEWDCLKAKVLELFAGQGIELRPRDVHDRLNIGRDQARRLLISLQDDGFIERTGDEMVVRYRRK